MGLDRGFAADFSVKGKFLMSSLVHTEVAHAVQFVLAIV